MTFTPFPSGSRREAVADVLMEQARLIWGRLSQAPFMRGARVSAISIYALVLRSAVTRFSGRSAGAVWILAAPMLRLGGMIALFSWMNRPAGAGDSLVIFFMTGMAPVFAIRHAFSGSGGSVRGGGGMMVFPQVTTFEVITANVLLELMIDVCVYVLIMLIMRAFTDLAISEWISEPLELIFACLLLSYFIYGLAFLSAQIGRFWQQWTDITRLMIRVLFFTSGVWFTMASLPPQLHDIVKYNPVAHIIEMIRDASIHGFESDLFDPWYPFWFATVCLFLGLFIDWLYRISGYDVDH
jgi:capsular polysaccharide transport system permease protein